MTLKNYKTVITLKAYTKLLKFMIYHIFLHVYNLKILYSMSEISSSLTFPNSVCCVLHFCEITPSILYRHSRRNGEYCRQT